MSDNPRMEHPDTTAGERAQMQEAAIAVQLSDQLAAVRDRITEAFDGLEVIGFRGELTLVTRPERVIDLLRFCREDSELACELLADLSGVHWPGGVHRRQAQETTGWPIYETEDEPGRIELDYVLYSITHNHRFRLRTFLDDETPRMPSAVDVYTAATWMELEVYDFLGVVFEGHPNLRRVLMPDDWEGHPHRRDYPLGGVEVQYKGATVPPPDERQY
jgi:NADH-quinone oxidoreductase subunit C